MGIWVGRSVLRYNTVQREPSRETRTGAVAAGVRVGEDGGPALVVEVEEEEGGREEAHADAVEEGGAEAGEGDEEGEGDPELRKAAGGVVGVEEADAREAPREAEKGEDQVHCAVGGGWMWLVVLLVGGAGI